MRGRLQVKQDARGLICPACGGAALPVCSGAVEYDRCDGCGGVWLDRGELEQLLAIAYRSGRERAGRDRPALRLAQPNDPTSRT